MNKRNVVLVNENNEERVFDSTKEARAFLDVGRETFRLAIKNNTSLKGWKFKGPDCDFKGPDQTALEVKEPVQTPISDFKPQIQTTKRLPFALCQVPGIEVDIDNIENFKGKCSLREECDLCHRYLTWQCDPSNYKFFPPKDVEPNISYVAPIIEKDIPTRKVRK